MTVYQLIRDQAHYDEMLALLLCPGTDYKSVSSAKRIVHIGNHYDLVQQVTA
jgi:hypothetical protein